MDPILTAKLILHKAQNQIFAEGQFIGHFGAYSKKHKKHIALKQIFYVLESSGAEEHGVKVAVVFDKTGNFKKGYNTEILKKFVIPMLNYPASLEAHPDAPTYEERCLQGVEIYEELQNVLNKS